MIAVLRRPPSDRRLKCTVSVAALIAGAITLASHGAVAGDVTVNAAYFMTDVFGNSAVGDPTARSGSASLNSLTLESGTSVNNAVGGEATPAESADDNRVVMKSGATVMMSLYGGHSTLGGAARNSVTIEGGSAGNVEGGESGAGHAERNSVDIRGGTVFGSVMGGYATGTGWNALSNTVTISGGSVGTVVGGYAQYAAATGNTVTISGGTVTGPLIAGGQTLTGSATDNTVTISGSPIFTNNNLKLYGGYCAFTTTCSDVFTGNRLELETSGLTVASLANFQYLDFYLPTTLAAGATMLTVTGTADLTNGSGTSSTVNVGINGASSPLAPGDSIKLLHAGTLVTAAGLNGTATGTGMQGVTLAYTFDITATATDLVATVAAPPTVTKVSKALSEGYVSGVSLINQGADLAAGSGMANAVAAAGEAWSTFGAVSGGSQRARTGSYVDLDGVSLMAGIARRFDFTAGNATAGLFAEYGDGRYDTFNRFASGVVRGRGNSHSYGGGLIGRFDFAATETGHAHAEATIRLGTVHNDFHSADLMSGGVAAGYEASSFYAGASAALGYAWTLGPATTLDVGGRYLWSRLDGDSVRLTTGETVDFDAVTSQRTRLGARLSHTLTGGWTPFAGAAWEHEFDGEAKATTHGLALDAPSLRGDTGIFEAGLTLKPSSDLPLALDLGLQGFVGRREGMAGGLRAKWTF